MNTNLSVFYTVASHMIDFELNSIPFRQAAGPREDASVMRIVEHVVCPQCVRRFERRGSLKKHNERKLGPSV